MTLAVLCACHLTVRVFHSDVSVLGGLRSCLRALGKAVIEQSYDILRILYLPIPFGCKRLSFKLAA